MIRALLDANVLISAAIRPAGPPGQIVAGLVLRSAFELILSPAILAEVDRALKLAKVRKYLREPGAALLWLADLVVLADVVADTGRAVGVCRDPADDAVLGAAIEGHVDVIVSGDADLLALGEYQGVAIVTPRAFLDLLRRGASR